MRKWVIIATLLTGAGFYLRTHYYLIDVVDYNRVHKDSTFNSPMIDYYVGLSYFMRERYEPATRCFIQLAEDFPNSGYSERALFHTAEAYEEMRDWENARQNYEKYFEQFPAGKDTAVARGRYDHIRFNH